MDALSRATDVLRVLRRFRPEDRLRALQDAARLLGGTVEDPDTAWRRAVVEARSAPTAPAGEEGRLRQALMAVQQAIPDHEPNPTALCGLCRILAIVNAALNPTPTEGDAR